MRERVDSDFFTKPVEISFYLCYLVEHEPTNNS
jgi:hypothetical protein